MWFRKNSPKSQVLCVERQVFSADENAAILAASKTDLMKKIRKELHCQLLSEMLFGGIDDKYRAGWMNCMSYFDGMIEMSALQEKARSQKALEQNGETTSMQMDERE